MENSNTKKKSSMTSIKINIKRSHDYQKLGAWDHVNKDGLNQDKHVPGHYESSKNKYINIKSQGNKGYRAILGFIYKYKDHAPKSY